MPPSFKLFAENSRTYRIKVSAKSILRIYYWLIFEDARLLSIDKKLAILLKEKIRTTKLLFNVRDEKSINKQCWFRGLDENKGKSFKNSYLDCLTRWLQI